MIYASSVALGEAYVVVRADLRQFGRDLRTQLRNTINQFEKEVKQGLGEKFVSESKRQGERAGDGVAEGLRNRLGNRRNSPWTSIGAALASGLDDGISALPAEVKAAIVGGLVLAAPFISAGLGAAITAGLGVGVVGLGVALGTQFEEVKTRYADFATNIREDLVRAADAFGPALLQAMDLVEQRVDQQQPLLNRLFDQAAPSLQGLVQGALDAVQAILESLDANFTDIQGFIGDLALGIEDLGEAAAFMIEELARTGPQGRQALRDLIDLLVLGVELFANWVESLTLVYSLMRDLTTGIGNVSSTVLLLNDALTDEGDEIRIVGTRADDTNYAMNLLVDTTKRQEKAAKEAQKAAEDYARALDKSRDAAFGIIDARIEFEEALDAITDKLKGGKDALNFETETGRDNLRLLEDAFRAAQDQAEKRFEKGELNADQARKYYEEEIDLIYRRAAAEGVSADQIKRVFDETIKLVKLPPPDPEFFDKLVKSAKALAKETNRAVSAALKLRDLAERGAYIPRGAGSAADAYLPGYADGGLITHDSIIRAGEGNKPEVMIPLTKPQRAAQLVAQSGLGRMLGAMGATLVQVFVGDEPLEQKMYRVVQGSNTVNGLALQYGPR